MTELSSVLVETADRIFRKSEAWPAGAFDAPLWRLTEQSGLDRLLLPETLGGAGDAYVDAVAIAMASGKHAAAIPLVETMVANWCLARAGLDVPEGPKAILIASDRMPPKVSARGEIDWGASAELIWAGALPVTVVLALRGDDLCVARIDAPVAGERLETIAGEPVTVARNLTVPGYAVAVWQHAADEPLALLALLKAAAIVGASNTLAALAIEYANVRVQFGRRIGSYQMIQQLIARMASEAAAASAAVQHAGWTFGSRNGIQASAIAKGRTSEAAGQVAAAAHHVHGAIGFTAEHSLHRYSRRLWAWREQAGNENFWYGRLGSAALRAGGAMLWPEIVNGQRL